MGTQKSYFLRGGDLVSFTWWLGGNSSCAGRLIWGVSDSKFKPKPVMDDDCCKEEGFPRHKLESSLCSRKMNVVPRQKVGEKAKRVILELPVPVISAAKI